VKQRLGAKKHKKCELLAGMSFQACFTRGGWEHGEAECWSDRHNAWEVNYLKGGVPVQIIKDGRFI